MKNNNNIFLSTVQAQIFYTGTKYYSVDDKLIKKSGEFSYFTYNFPANKKDLKSEAEKILSMAGISYDKITKVTYNVYAGKKKGLKVVTIKF